MVLGERADCTRSLLVAREFFLLSILASFEPCTEESCGFAGLLLIKYYALEAGLGRPDTILACFKALKLCGLLDLFS